jgi:hypothetical protein
MGFLREETGPIVSGPSNVECPKVAKVSDHGATTQSERGDPLGRCGW